MEMKDRESWLAVKRTFHKTQQLWAEKIWKNTGKKGNKKGALESLQMR